MVKIDLIRRVTWCCGRTAPSGVFGVGRFWSSGIVAGRARGVGVVLGRREKHHTTIEVERPARIVLTSRAALVSLVAELAAGEQFAICAHTATVTASRP